jgi:hypothetical protein
VSTASVAASPAVRAVRGWFLRVVDQTRGLARDARPWLRRETWTRENLAALGAAARRRPRRTASLLGLGLLGALAVYELTHSATAGLPTASVKEGPFRVTIVEAGTLQALRSVTYSSSIQSNQAKIVALAPEGKMVQKGDLLILFDAAPFEEEIRKSQAQLAQAQADLDKARQGRGA